MTVLDEQGWLKGRAGWRGRYRSDWASSWKRTIGSDSGVQCRLGRKKVCCIGLIVD